MRNDGEIVDKSHWDRMHSGKLRMRLPSLLRVGTRNLQRLLAERIGPGNKVLEIGFAPGKHLSYVAAKYGADVTGIDFSIPGVETAKRLFSILGITADLRCENIFETTLPPGTFDFVYSVGVIEHFADPREIVDIHARLLRKGGRALILIPNYRNIYGRIQNHFDPASLLIHNLDIMTIDALRSLTADLNIVSARTFSAGRLDPGIISWSAKWPRLVSDAVEQSLGLIGLLQPVDIPAVAPWLALEIDK